LLYFVSKQSQKTALLPFLLFNINGTARLVKSFPGFKNDIISMTTLRLNSNVKNLTTDHFSSALQVLDEIRLCVILYLGNDFYSSKIGIVDAWAQK
jgi:hypothetical protein